MTALQKSLYFILIAFYHLGEFNIISSNAIWKIT